MSVPLNRSKSVDLPLRAVQFGEGNFLRAFVDWMIQHLNDKGLFHGTVQIVQPIPEGRGDILNEQDGLYTVLLRGIEKGQIVDQSKLITSVRGCSDAQRDWKGILALAAEKSLRFVFSNTTEAGIEYKPEPLRTDQTPNTFPAKLTAFLFERFRRFGNESGNGLIVLPCELIEQNGACLKSCVLRYAADWNLGDDFVRWIETENRFLNTLVDRIVSGYPSAADEICRQLGYQDRLLVVAEPFHFWVIEGPESLDQELPLRQSGLQVVWTNDITPYRTRKVRLLNGGHTGTVLAAFLSGLDFVHEMVADPVFSGFLKALLFEEVLPTIDLPKMETSGYIESVLERFANPFANHRLQSIALNSVSKWKTRILPSLLDYWTKTGRLPSRLVFSLAALTVFYKNSGGIGRREDGLEYTVPDSKENVEFFETLWNDFDRTGDYADLAKRVLAEQRFWDRNLNELGSITEHLADDLKNIRQKGIKNAIGR